MCTCTVRQCSGDEARQAGPRFNKTSEPRKVRILVLRIGELEDQGSEVLRPWSFSKRFCRGVGRGCWVRWLAPGVDVEKSSTEIMPFAARMAESSDDFGLASVF